MPKRRRTSVCYTVEPGRQIYRKGKPFVSVGREGDTRPTDADDTTHLIAKLLNRRGCR